MNMEWKTAAIGGAIGAAFSLAIVFACARFGILPVASDTRIHDYLMAHPGVLYDMSDKLQKQDAAQQDEKKRALIAKIGLKRFFDPAVAFVTGPANAKNTFVEFFDYNCGHCRNTYPAVQKFYEKHKNDTRFAFIDFPIFGESSTNAARTAVAARLQGDKYVAFHFGLMGEGQGEDAGSQELLLANAKKAGLDIPMLSADIVKPETDKAILAALRLAHEAGFRGTPVFIINGKVHDGEISEAEIRELMKG